LTVGNDGRFLIPLSVEQSDTHPITLLVNWQVGLKK